LFAETPTAFLNLTCLAHGLIGRIPADTFHRAIPGSDPSTIIEGENTIGHGVDNLFNKMNVPNFVSF